MTITKKECNHPKKMIKENKIDSVIKIIYQDSDFLVVNKPAKMLVYSPAPKEKSLIKELSQQQPLLTKVGQQPRYGIVHRLDKEASGIVLVAKNDRTLSFFQKQFQERKVGKKYYALVWGTVKPTKGILKDLIGRSKQDFRKQKIFLPHSPLSINKRTAESTYRLIRQFIGCALLEVTIKTGRRHQIRIQLTERNHPLVGDKLYGFKDQNQKQPRLFLHGFFLKIKLPNGEEKSFNSPLPLQLKNILLCLS